MCLVFFSSCGEDIISELQDIDTLDNTEVTYGPPLPTIKIDTNGAEIVDEPKIPAEFQIFQENIILEEHNIGIEIRGSSSQFFDKKSYGFETWDENNEDSEMFDLLNLFRKFSRLFNFRQNTSE